MQRAMKWALSILGSAAILFGGFVILHGSLPPASINAWLPAGNMAAARAGAASVLLQDGRLLITGGNGASGALATTEVLDPATGFTAGPSMSIARSNHVAVLLQDGRVLVAGGTGADGRASQSAELFDPVANSWSASGPLMVGRSGATATLLPSGHVLIAGGTANGATLASLELFDPSPNTFSLVAGTLSSPRENHSAALLPDGRVLIAGGWDGTTLAPVPPATTGAANVLASTDVFDPSTGAVAPGPALTSPRMNFTATTALDGSVVAIGGTDGVNDLASIDILAPGAGAFALSGANLTSARQGHVAFLLPHNGNILVVGGTSGGTAVSAVELYTPWTGATSVTGAMASARSGATGSPLSQMVLTAPVGIEGALLVAGGVDASSPPATLQSAEVYGFATVTTDKDDYAPGTTVTITGSGWVPGETVTLSLLESPYYDTHPDLTAVADDNGNIVNAQFSPDEHDVGIRFYLTAVGSASQAQTTFTDANPTLSVTATGPTGSGTVTSSDSNISCAAAPGGNNAGTCVHTYGANFSGIILTATANAGFAFTGWSGNAACTGTGTCSASQTGNGTFAVTATFAAVGPATQLRVETAANGSGTVVTAQNVTSGNSLTVFAIERDASDHFVGNVAASWSLISKTLGVADTDLVPSGDTKSAVFTGHLVGTAQIHAGADSLTGNSGTLTVVPGALHHFAFNTISSPQTAGTAFNVTITAQDAGNNTVTTYDGNGFKVTLSSTGTLVFVNPSAAFTLGVLTASVTISNTGNFTITATGTGSNSGITGTSNSFDVNSPGPTKLAFSTTALTGVVGQCLGPITAQTQDASNLPTNPTSDTTVNLTTTSSGSFFSDSGCSLGTTTLTILTTGNNASFYYKDPHVGTPMITAADAAAVLTSATQTETINKADTTTSVSSNHNPSVFGQSVTFTATVAVNNPGSGTPTGTVDFKDGATTIASAVALSGGQATFSTSSLSVATHSITVVYSGDSDFNATGTGSSTATPLSQEVDKADTSSTVTSNHNPSVFGQSVTFTATVSAVSPGAGTPTGTVDFKDGATTIQSGVSLSGGQATFSTSLLSVTGSPHSITAVYSGDGNFYATGADAGSTATALSQVVNKANTSTTVTSDINPSTLGQLVTFTATVAAVSPGAGTPTGNVQFYDGAALLGTGALNESSPDTATFSTSSLGPGDHNITAHYVGDDNFEPSTSAIYVQSVHYNFIGFLAPIANLPLMNSVKGGQTIPIKWQLTDASGNYISDLGTMSNIKLVPVVCSVSVPIDDSSVDTTGGTVFRYDFTDNQFIYNWKTAKGWKGCLGLEVDLNDGTSHYANFQFK